MERDDDEEPDPASVRLRGIGASPGVASGPIVCLGQRYSARARQVAADATAAEVERFERAVGAAAAELRDAAARSGPMRTASRAVLDAYALMVADPLLRNAVTEQIREQRRSAPWAVASAIATLSAQLAGAKDVYLRERSLDVQFVGELLQRRLLGLSDDWIGGGAAQLPVLIADALSPARAALLRPGQVGALVTERGSRTSHLAVVANSMGVPCVVACSGALRLAGAHAVATVDGDSGEVTFSRHQPARDVAPEPSRAAPKFPPSTRCGVPFELFVNVCSAHEVTRARQEGISGVGLYRSEFLLARSGSAPSEQEQYEAYRRIVEAASPLPVTLRTFDVGGDKFAEQSGVPPSSNPALGLRGVRWALAQPERLEVQLRAMLRASQHGDVRILVPMVTTVDEVRAVRECLERVVQQLGSPKQVPLGCMVETPAAALRSRHLAREAQLLSIGSNDLLQYTLAADRGEPALHALCSPFDPAALLLVKQVIGAAHEARVPLSVCGIMATDPLAVGLLAGLGVRAFSVEFNALRGVRRVLEGLQLEAFRALAEHSLVLPSAEAVALEARRRLGPPIPA